MGGRAHAAECDSNLMIVLDRSCSMDQTVEGDTRTKWEVSVDALATLTTDYRDRLRFGLIMFPDEDGERCDQDGPIYVTTGEDRAAEVMTAVTETQPDGPCVTNIDTAIGQVASDPAFPATPDPTRRSFVLLITDGKQSGSCGGTARDTDTEALIADLAVQGYPTYVVGFGSGVRPETLESFALAGGVPRPGGGVVYYQADTAAELDAAIAAIAGDIGGDPEFGGCTGLPCPDGVCLGESETCESGTCVAPTPDAGPVADAATSPGDADAGIGGGGGAGGGDGESTSGCGCRTSGPGGSGAWSVLALLGLWVVRRRRARS